MNSIIKRTKQGGGEIVSLLKTGSAFYAPATSAIVMVESFLFDKKRILLSAAKIKVGQYGLTKPLFVGVPVKIGSSGIEEIVELSLTEGEQTDFKKSVNAVIELNRIADIK